MRWMAEAWRRLQGGLRRNALEEGLDEEIRFHVDQQTRKNIAAGMTPAEARRHALVAFGGREQVKERTMDEVRPALFEDFVRDLRYGVRILRRAPGFAVVTIFTLALGIGAATTVFTVVNGVLLSPLPYPNSDRIVRLYQIGSNGRQMNVSEPNFEDWKSGTRSFAKMAEISPGSVPVSTGDEPAITAGSGVSRDFFDVMGVHPLLGRGFLESELHVGAPPAVIVGHGFWERRLGRAPLGNLSVRIEGTAFNVVGIMPPGFGYPTGSEFWVPRELEPPQRSRTAHNFQVIARLAPGVALRTAQFELSALSRSLKARYGDGTWMSDAAAVPLRDQLTASARPALLLLFGAAALLLVIACLNVSTMQLARASARQRELAVRLALGAGRGRVTRQLLAEALVLTAAAGAIGVAIAMSGVRTLVALQPANLPRIEDVAVDARALGFALLVAVATAFIVGLATALRASHGQIRATLSDAQRTTAGGPTERIRQSLVVAQVALTIVLLAGAGLMGRSFMRVLAIDPGFRTEGTSVLDLTWPFTREPEAGARRSATQQEVIARLRELPGVQDAGLISAFPIGAAYFPNGRFIEMTRPDEIQGLEDFEKLGEEAKNRAGMAAYRVASAGYFTVMGIPLLRGRLFEDGDGPDAPHVAVISESLARTKWPDRDPIDRFVQFGNMDGDLRGFRIVGIVGDVREVSTEAVPGPIFYGHYRQRQASQVSVVARTTSPGVTARAARQLVREVDPDVPVQVRTVEEALDRALAGRRFSLMLIGVFAGTALVLATLGIYGLISYLVAERTREIGIRLALGADSGDILKLVIGKGTVLAAIGMAVGVAAALALTRFLRGMLFGIGPSDPIAFGAVLGLTLAAVLVASYLPGRRATKVAPVVAMKAE